MLDYLDLLYIHQPAGNWMAGYRQLEKARFDREGGTKEEIRECARLIRGVKRGAVSSAKTWRRVYTVVIRGWQRK